MTDEYLLLNLHALADEGMRLDLASGAYYNSTLNLDERTDLTTVADPTAVHIH